jgi:hypothetical protein
MDNSIKDLRRFIIREIISKDSKWSTEGRTDFYSNKYLTIKKDFDGEVWYFKLNTDSKFYELRSIGINKILQFILIFLIKINVRKQIKLRKNDGLLQSWSQFLSNNKDIKRDNKIDEILK